jgi:S-adenosylmethionine-diacylglycerol 3-amino-3-carboxypropyl transferase
VSTIPVARMVRVPTAAGSDIATRASFDFLRYASVWEDADALCEALAPVAKGGRLLSIASAGDNALALLTLDPGEVVAVDLSVPQLAAVELRVAAFRRLEWEELTVFLGAAESGRRLEVYRLIRNELSPSARAFWDANPESIRAGPIHAGKFERYLRTFRQRVLPLVHDRRTIDRLLEPKEAAERHRFYRQHWDTRRWRLVFRLFFSRFVMGRLGRDPEFFAHVSGQVGDRILDRTRHALTNLSTHDNPYLTYIMTGGFAAGALPRYLRQEHFRAIRDRLGRLRVVQAAAHQVPGTFDGFNLSDIFEYMGAPEHAFTYGSLARNARPGARLVYWNLLAPRGVPDELGGVIEPLAAVAADLHHRDRAWFYAAMRVDRVRAEHFA